MSNCRLDRLPVELIHQLLSYFSAHEIFHSFIHVSSYIDAILLVYSNYRINFKSINRTNFDLICQHIVPDQVVALTLSNDENTPGLIDLFLSRFQVNQFTRLQSLRLIEIGADFWEIIITQMVELKHLRSFCFFPSNRGNSWVCNLPSDYVTELDKSLFERYAPVLPQLYQLRLCHGDYLNSVQFPCLRRLLLERSTTDLIQHISVVAPQLELLETSFSDDVLPKELIRPLPRLNRLVLRIQRFNVSMNDLERMMSNLPCLRHLELYTSCNNDVVDGQRWQMKTKDLVTFRFLFRLSRELDSHELESFRTPFWLEEKYWFVAYTYRRLFSVPDLNATESNQNFSLPLCSTVPDNRIFYENIDKLQLRDEVNDANDYFPHVQRLELSSTTSLFTIEKILDLSRVQHLVFSSSMENFPVKRMINEMPNLRQITIRSDIQNFLDEVCCERLEKIRALHISNSIMDAVDYNIDHLCIVFANIEHLQVDHKCSTLQIFDFLDRFKHLLTASFHYISWYDEEDVQEWRANIQSTLDRVRRVQGLNYTYRFDCSSVHFWI